MTARPATSGWAAFLAGLHGACTLDQGLYLVLLRQVCEHAEPVCSKVDEYVDEGGYNHEDYDYVGTTINPAPPCLLQLPIPDNIDTPAEGKEKTHSLQPL